MAHFVIGPLISMLNGKVSSYLLKQYKVMDGMEEERDKLERNLLAILDIIQDAEEKGAHRAGVGAWLKALKKVANEANDVFDEFKYEALRRDAKARGHHRKLPFGIVSPFPAHNPIVFRYRMGKKLCRILHSIEVLVTEMNSHGFRNQQQAPPSKEWRMTDSIIPDSEKDIVSRSRHEEKKKILNILINQASSSDLTVLPIVGMGGLGKTSFAQLVYNDPEIKEHFQLQRWCCVSDDFDVAKIASSICQTSENNREKALQNLQTEVSGKRYLIVLDDVWNEDADKWEKLKTCLKHGGKGSVVLTTTRKAQVAQIMKTVDDSYNLSELHTVFLKEIFENRAFCLQKPNAPELSDVVEKILDRCRGSPLAAKAFGSMLSNKTSMKEWIDILNRSNTSSEKTGILPILKLSYDDLPSHMKLCFAFCAIFPKDYLIGVEFLIQLWMAHDCIQLNEGDNLENVCRETFDELTRRSFFQDVKRRPKRESWQLHSETGTVCSIHDLMHDIALSVMGEDCVTIDGSNSEKLLLSAGPARHLFSTCSLHMNCSEDYVKKHSQSLQSMLCSATFGIGLAQHLSKYNHLRALRHCDERKFSLRPRHLQYLRYLDLSMNHHIEELPKEISILYNLQTLDLSDCIWLVRLPKDMKYMKSLRHLYATRCISLKGMPPDLGQLTSLRTLTYFVVGSSPGCSNIRELRDLNLGGELELSCLQHVTEEDAKSSNIGSKENLAHLSLKWSDDRIEELEKQRCVLDALKPPAALESLRIRSYKGTGFPTWVTCLTMLQHLTELHLDGCTMCDEFPQFGQFKALEVLVLKRLEKLQILCNHNSSAAFPVLKDLKLENLDIFDRWVATEGEELTFPLLENVTIEHCPKLSTLPEAPKLKVIKLKEDKAQLLLSIFRSRYMPCLSELFLSVSDTEATPALNLDEDREASLSEIVLNGRNFLFPSSPPQPAVGFWKCFGQLVSLVIESCDTLIYWPEEEFRSLVSLKNLCIHRCSKLKGCRPRGSDQLPPNLKALIIENCESLTELSVLPPSLSSIFIYACDSLESVLGQDDRELNSQQHFDTAASLENCNDVASASMPEQSPPSRINALPCLQSLAIYGCKKLRFVPAQLDTLRYLDITGCSVLDSLDCLGDLPLLATLCLRNCKHLLSVPGSHGNYSALEQLVIAYCPAMNMKPLYAHLRQRPNSLYEDISRAGSSDPYEGPKLWEPKSWKYAIPGCR